MFQKGVLIKYNDETYGFIYKENGATILFNTRMNHLWYMNVEYLLDTKPVTDIFL